MNPNEDLSNVGMTEQEIIDLLTIRASERRELQDELDDLCAQISSLEGRLQLSRTSRRNAAARLQAISKAKKTTQAAERRALERGRKINFRECDEADCQRLARFYEGEQGWCKRHVPENVRPHGKVT